MVSAAFRRSTYLTLAVACALLGYAESTLFPEIGVFAVVVVVALGVIYRVETRVPLLSLAAANRLGAAIGFVALAWAGIRIRQEYLYADYATLGWPLFLVALVAPVLMAAIAAKLLRREKHAGDYWQLHAAALGAVVLGGAIIDELSALAFMVAYTVCAVWGIAEFFLARTSGTVPPVNAAPAGMTPTASPTATTTHFSFARAILWTTIAAIIAFPLYLVTPRSTFEKLDFGQPRIEIGYAADQMIDLNLAGDLRANSETAFELTATEDDGRPKDDLNISQRWRGRVLTTYTRGNWRRDRDIPFPNAAPQVNRLGEWSPPNLGEGRYRLTFSVPAKMRAQFLADPVTWEPGEPAPIADLTSDGPPQPWLPVAEGSFARIGSAKQTEPNYRYVQYLRPMADPNLGPAYPVVRDVDRILLANPIASVTEYTDRVLDRLVRTGRLSAAARSRNPVRMLPDEEHHEAISRALNEHLATRPDLIYTTNLRREFKDIDPVEEFLFRTHTGHCERFATALVLMLRSQGIPSVFVLGFKGCEPVGNGRYLVQQEFAHAWAEALISRPLTPPAGGRRDPRVRDWHWLSLDPTPVSPATTAAAESNEGWLARLRQAFDRYVVHYSPEAREAALNEIGDAVTSRTAILGAVGVVLFATIGVTLIRRASSRTNTPQPLVGWFDRLPALLARHGHVRRSGETPREFAQRVGNELRTTAAAVPWADVPAAWVEALYRERFGGLPLPSERLPELEAALDSLARALDSTHRGTR